MKAEGLLVRLKEDYTSGALEISLKAIETLTVFLKETRREWRRDLSDFCKRLAETKPTMASLFNITHEALLEARRKGSTKESLKRVLLKMRTNLKDAVIKIGKEGRSILPKRAVLMTHSRSASVFAVVKKGVKGGKVGKVYATQSYPLGEGITFSREIEELGVETHLIPDATIGIYLSSCDCVLVGGDALTEKFVVNKVGSLPLALAAHYYKIPLYCVLDTLKFIPSKFYNPPEEKNSLFEAFPLSLVTRFITEGGMMKPIEVRKRIRKIEIR